MRLPALIGLSRAMDMMLTGRPVKAKEAYEMGLANRVVPKGSGKYNMVFMNNYLKILSCLWYCNVFETTTLRMNFYVCFFLIRCYKYNVTICNGIA